MIGGFKQAQHGVTINYQPTGSGAGRTDFVRILPEMTFRRTYWLMTHADTHAARRVATCREFLVRRFREERRRFVRQYENG